MVLAASRGEELGELTVEQPKTMVKIQGTPILSHIVDAYNAVGMKDILVVRGYKKEAVNLPNLTYIDNADYSQTGELASLSLALQSRKEFFSRLSFRMATCCSTSISRRRCAKSRMTV